MTSLLPQRVIEEFDANGFVITENMLSDGELDVFGPAVDRAVRRRTADDGRSLDEKTSYEQSFIQCMRLWETDPDVRPLTFHPSLAQAAAELLGVTTVRLWQDQALYKEPGGRITDAHQDTTFWPVGTVPMVTAWIPFDGSSPEQGATGYVPGSHKLGPLTRVNLTRTTEAYDLLADEKLAGREPVHLALEKGSVVWHHGLTVHNATPNVTDTVRRVFTVVYFADGFPRAEAWPSFPLDRAGVAVGEPMAGDGLPVVWPRPKMPPWPEPPALIGPPTGPQVMR